MDAWPRVVMAEIIRTGDALTRIADALERAYPKGMSAPAGQLFDDPKVDPVSFVMDTWGETRADAESIVETAKPKEEVE